MPGRNDSLIQKQKWNGGVHSVAFIFDRGVYKPAAPKL